MSENPYRQDNPFVSDESFQEKIKRLEAENPQPEYCDCDGHHDGSCHQRRIDDLRAALERAERDRNLLADEVRAWRAWYEEEMEVNVTEPILYQMMVNAWRATEDSGALNRAKEHQ